MLSAKEARSILLEEYRNCTLMLNEANRLNWTRYSIHLVISSALFTLWGTLWLYLADKIFTVLIALSGILVAITWFFINHRSMGYNDFWIERLREIEYILGGIMTTFRKSREDRFWTEESFWRRRRIRYSYQVIPIVFFVAWWLILYLSEVNKLLAGRFPLAEYFLEILSACFLLGLPAFYCKDRWYNKMVENEKLKKTEAEEQKKIEEYQENPPWSKKKKPETKPRKDAVKPQRK